MDEETEEALRKVQAEAAKDKLDAGEMGRAVGDALRAGADLESAKRAIQVGNMEHGNKKGKNFHPGNEMTL